MLPEPVIVRVSSRRRYTAVPAAVTEDSRLSYAALGLLCYLLGRPDDWEVDAGALAGSRGTTEYAVRKLLKELRSRGYARLARPRDPDTGRVAGTTYEVTDEPDGWALRPETADDVPGLDGGPLSEPERAYATAFGADALARLNAYQRELVRKMKDAGARAEAFHVWRGNDYLSRNVSGLLDRYERARKEAKRAAASAGRPAPGRTARTTRDVTAEDALRDAAEALNDLQGAGPSDRV
jgi:hypothetical protein